MSWRIYALMIVALALALAFCSPREVRGGEVNVEPTPDEQGFTMLRLTPEEVKQCRDGGGCTLVTEEAEKKRVRRLQEYTDTAQRCRAAVNRDWYEAKPAL